MKIKKKFVWKWCAMCACMYIECPGCGNNCCNGGGFCSICPLAYQYQELGWKTRSYPKPTKKEIRAAERVRIKPDFGDYGRTPAQTKMVLRRLHKKLRLQGYVK